MESAGDFHARGAGQLQGQTRSRLNTHFTAKYAWQEYNGGTGVAMKAQPARENSGNEAKPSCEAVSHLDEPCNESASVFCDKCERWFCAAHAHDDLWHTCQLEPGEEGGEG